MANSDLAISLYAFKWIQGKAMTDVAKGAGNEAETVSPQFTANDILFDAIPNVPSTAVSEGVAQFVMANLVADPTSNGHAFFAVWPVGLSEYPQGVQAGDRVKNALSPRFGVGYEAKPRAGSNAISVNDARNWIYEYQAGVFFQETLVGATPTVIDLWVYVGETLASKLGDTGDFPDWDNVQNKPTLGYGIFDPVPSLGSLTLIDTTDPALYPDSWIIHVPASGLWYLDRNSVEGPSGNVVVPVSEVGRWKKLFYTITEIDQLLAMVGGGGGGTSLALQSVIFASTQELSTGWIYDGEAGTLTKDSPVVPQDIDPDFVGTVEPFARILIKDQTDQIQNGIYFLDLDNNRLVRTEDFVGNVVNGSFVWVINGEKEYRVIGTNALIGVDIDAVVWEESESAIDLSNYITETSIGIAATNGSNVAGLTIQNTAANLVAEDPTNDISANTKVGTDEIVSRIEDAANSTTIETVQTLENGIEQVHSVDGGNKIAQVSADANTSVTLNIAEGEENVELNLSVQEGIVIYDRRTVAKGAEYELDTIGNDFTSRSLVHRKWVEDYIASIQAGNFHEETVADIAERDAYDVENLPTNVFVQDDGDGKWALYKANTVGVGATYTKIMDQDLFSAEMSAAAIKAAYESNEDTNAFTDTLKAKLEALTGAYANQTLSNLTNIADARKNLGIKYVPDALVTGATVTWSFLVSSVQRTHDVRDLLDPPTTDFTLAINDSLSGAMGFLRLKKTTVNEQIIYLTSNNAVTDWDNQVQLTALVLPAGEIGDEYFLSFIQFGTERKWISREGQVVNIISASTTDVPSVGLMKSITDQKHGQGGSAYGAKMVTGTTDNNDVGIVRNNVARMDILSTAVAIYGTDSTGTVGLYLRNSASASKFEVYNNGNVAIGAVGSFGGGVGGVIFQVNATTVPTTNPVGGAISYVSGGIMYVRRSDGTINTIGVIPDTIGANTILGNLSGTAGAPGQYPAVNLYHALTMFLAFTQDGNPDVFIRGPWSQIGDATLASINGSTARTSLFGTPAPWASKVRMAGTFTVGQQIEILMHGVISFNGSSETLEIRGLINGVQVVTTGLFTGAPMGIPNVNKSFRLRVIHTVRSLKVGATLGTMDIQGTMEFQGPTGNSPVMASLVNTAVVNFDDTIDNTFDVDAQWVAADALSSIQSRQSKIIVAG
jgi:hypothetical protein